MGLKLVPLPEHMQLAWRHGAWGNATDTHAAGGLLKLTDALPHKTGWAAHPAPSPAPSPLPSPSPSPPHPHPRPNPSLSPHPNPNPGMAPEDLAYQLADDLLQLIPEAPNPEATAGSNDGSALYVVLLQELQRYCALLSKVRRDP